MLNIRALSLALSLLAGAAAAQEVTLVIDTGGEEVPGLRPTLRAASLTMELRNTADVMPQDYVAAARADYRRLLTGLYSEGYYSGLVSIRIEGREAATIAPLDAPQEIGEVEILVTAGPRFVFGQAEVAPLPLAAELPEGFAPGQIARSDVIGDAVEAGVRAWREDGHAKAEPAGQRIVARHPQRELDAAVTIAPGPRLTFGALAVEGNEAVRAERIRAIAGLPVGTVFSPSELDAAAARLRRTGTFSTVRMVEGAAQPDLTLPVTAQLVEQAPRRIGAGAEISSVEGLTLSAFWLHRNLLGGAERFRVEGEVTGIGGETGGVDYRLGTTFNRPASFGPLTALYAEAQIESVDDPNYKLDQVSAEIGLSRQASDTLRYELGVGFLAAEVEDAVGRRSYQYLTLPAALDWNTRNSDLDATEGAYVRAELTPFVSVEDGGAGGRLYADGRIYRSFGAEDRLTLAARGQVGAVVGVASDEAPADYLFYSGGGGTVRGQPYQSLGVALPGGGEIGGRQFLGTQLEARLMFTDRIGGVAFYDAGLIGPEPFSDEGAEWHGGAGLGFRYETGIGPIRLDIGVPTTGDDAGERVEVYLGIGQSF